jgi:hypothetical protein
VTPLVLSTTSRDVESARRDTFKRVRDDRNIIASKFRGDSEFKNSEHGIF